MAISQRQRADDVCLDTHILSPIVLVLSECGKNLGGVARSLSTFASSAGTAEDVAAVFSANETTNYRNCSALSVSPNSRRHLARP